MLAIVGVVAFITGWFAAELTAYLEWSRKHRRYKSHRVETDFERALREAKDEARTRRKM